MGEVTTAVVVQADGRPGAAADVQAAIRGLGSDLVELGYDYDAALLPTEGERSRGLWRWAGLLPLDAAKVRYPLHVGATPLLAPPRLRSALGMHDLHLKDETRGPTGSNKDRATALVAEHALRTGMATITCASTGNVAVSLAVGAAASGLEAVIFVPAGVSDTKLRVMLAAGATVVTVERGYEAAFQLSREAVRAFGWCDRNTGVNPLTVEAKKTVAFEIWDDLGRSLPDVVVAPVGDGPTLDALAKGFRELRACGATDLVPRLVGVQAEGCQPVTRAWEAGAAVEPVYGRTIADGIAVGAPVSGALVLRDVRETGGGLVAVTDEAMLEAISELASQAGVIAEPAGAAALAGLRPALAGGLVAPDERVIVLVTGTGLKAPQHLAPAGRVHRIHGQLREVEQALAGAGAA